MAGVEALVQAETERDEARDRLRTLDDGADSRYRWPDGTPDEEA